MLLVLPFVLVKNEERLDTGALLALARQANLTAELGMFLDLTSELSGRQWFRELASQLTPREGPPRYYPEPRGGKYGRALADERTPAVVRRWGFRMDASEEDLRHFLRKHADTGPALRGDALQRIHRAPGTLRANFLALVSMLFGDDAAEDLDRQLKR